MAQARRGSGATTKVCGYTEDVIGPTKLVFPRGASGKSRKDPQVSKVESSSIQHIRPPKDLDHGGDHGSFVKIKNSNS